MDTAEELRPGDEGFDGFRMRLPEDCVEYMLFVIGEKTDSLPSLEAIRKAAEKKLDEIAKDYIWQRDPFKLETKIQKGLGMPYLHGTTHYGDNVEDEWLIVYLLRELTKSFPNLWVRIFDSDGEFLLIEAAKVTPPWLSPENDTNRKYPAHISLSTQHSLATIPRKLAYILHLRPQAIAPATEAFYLRDPRSLKPVFNATIESAAKDLLFPPTDLVTISADLQKIVERFEAFLNDDQAGMEGAEVDEMDQDDDDSGEEESDEDEDKEVSFDEEQFARMMREMMGLPAEDVPRDKGKQRVVEEVEEEDDEDDEEEIRKLMEQMESELKGHGALELDPKPNTAAAIREKGELSKTEPAKPEDEEGSGDEVDIDYNLAKNLLESFKSQAGMAGPAGNLLGLMGMTLPRDEEDADDKK
ncbi:hypothetical protein N0V88_006124 [Collariella sp. IMI 366227]|nr:hypothetical protein N0V88_006124 [Collariella sp. IMI 366227]